MGTTTCKTVACSVVYLLLQSAAAVERRPLMRRVERHTRRSGLQNVHTAGPTSQPFEAHGPGRPREPKIQNTSRLVQKASRRAPSEFRFDKAALFVSGEILLTTPIPTAAPWLEMAFKHPVPGMHREQNQMFKSLPLPPEDGDRGKAKESVVIESSGISEIVANSRMHGPGLASAGLMDLMQVPTTTAAAVAAVTTAAALAATTAAAGAAVPVAGAAAAAAPAAGAAAAPANSGGGGMGIGSILAIVVVILLVALGASMAIKHFMGKKVAGRLDGVKDSPDSQYWKSAKARQTYRKSQLSVPKAGGDDDSDQEGDSASGQGRGMIQQESSSGGKSSSYRDRRGGKRSSESSDKRGTESDKSEDQAPSQKSSSYRGRRQQQAKRDAAGDDDVTV